ncbi:HAMP domain-containing histidine kinase [Allokutzneria sp. A3M-2-11 16]|uniref:sensor histidine kinase n=1 Tax=Allokutzneria sp. A3M-2-11 16 TaxID=2962043 RepID=UPI0020B6B231|nr:HAMP domain-containing sensor histidine kinase [Allokutzneria sp. A3M-2-11 16]MCP3800765.1 HAMP domain-containing histidine kinase [Allokutzneria sp. A3M-2-11 16]
MDFLRPTVRTKLTALYSGLFLASGTVLVTVVYLLMSQTISGRVSLAISKSDVPELLSSGAIPATPLPTSPGIAVAQRMDALTRDFTAVTVDTTLSSLLIYSALALILIAALSVVAGWWISGRVLRPLHQITATAQRLSSANLHERIALAGPRDELTELAGTFDTMLDRLQHAFDSQRRFIANASHELRTPLAIQRAAIQIGLKNPSEAQLAEVSEQMLEANRRSERLIDGLLLLARSDRGIENRVPVELHRVVADVVEQHSAAAAARSIEVEVNAEPLLVLGDLVLLTQLVTNLVGNAVRHNVDGGQIWVRTNSRSGLQVVNTGQVIAPGTVPLLFEPFRRGTERTGSADGGAGLGLSIVSSIAQAHGGTVLAEARAKGGLHVRVTLPLRSSPSHR